MSFEKAFDILMQVEGFPLVNDPNDPGGLTKYGISQRAYPKLDIAALTLDQAKQIYYEDYYLKCKCDKLLTPLNIMVFDCAVNQGPGTAIVFLQYILKIKIDNIIGIETIKAANQNVDSNVVNYMSHRALQYTNLNNWHRYGRGWMNRLFIVMQKAYEA